MINIVLVCSVLLFKGFVSADQVPVLVWGPFNNDKPAQSLKSFSADEFIDILNQHITSDTFVLVVSEDKLTTEDLSQCKTANGQGHTCFQGIQRIKNKLYLTNVQNPIQVIDDMAGLHKTDITIASNGDLSEPLDAVSGNYVFINFEDNASNETTSMKLTRHDELIAKLYGQLSLQNPNLMVIYTGKRSDYRKRFARQVQQSSSTIEATFSKISSTFSKSDQVLMYYTRLSIDNESIYFQDMFVTAVNRSELQVSLFFKTNSSLIYNTSLDFNIIGKRGYWHVNNFTWGNLSYHSDMHIYARDNFSYHCPLPIKLASKNGSVIFRFYGLQLQARFTGHPLKKFGAAYDCIGFVSPVILSGLFVTFILVFILFIGISCMMEIKTMDRFDNPKGKTITVTNDYDS